MIRQLCAEDLEVFRSLFLDGAQRFPNGFLRGADEVAAIPQAQLLSGLDTGTYWGVFDAVDLIAFAAMRQGGVARLRHMAEIGPVYVRPSHQSRGIGRRLLSKMIEHARGLGLLQLELTVDCENQAAVALYQALGFAQFGLRPRSALIDGQPRDDLLMLLQLDQ